MKKAVAREFVADPFVVSWFQFCAQIAVMVLNLRATCCSPP
jgi:hypothetical protein